MCHMSHFLGYLKSGPGSFTEGAGIFTAFFQYTNPRIDDQASTLYVRGCLSNFEKLSPQRSNLVKIPAILSILGCQPAQSFGSQ